LISINPDAHSTAGLDDLEFGIGTARKAWLEKKDVLTTRHWDEARNLFGRRPVRTNVRTG
jgi:DNA polymerase (family 10)